MLEVTKLFNEIPSALTIIDNEGKILYMNEKSKKTFESYGGGDLIGKSIYTCHMEKSATKMKEMITNASSNVYTIEKKGIKKLIYQTPWTVDGKVSGLVELSIELPENMPHFVRK